MNLFLSQAIDDPAVRVILIRSNGKNFCLGMDLRFLQESQGDDSLAREVINSYVRLLSTIYNAPKTVIALVNGNVKAGGMGLVSACDIIISSEDSTFELSEVLLGIIPANVLPFLMAQRISTQKARYLVLTAARLSAKEAMSLGIVDEVYPEEDLNKKIKSLLKNLFRAAPLAVAETKAFTRAISGISIEKASEMAQDKLFEMIKDPVTLSGITAFNEGSIPEWFARFKPENDILIREEHE